MSKKIPFICKDNIPVLISTDMFVYFKNINKLISNEHNKIQITEIDAHTFNKIIEYINLLNTQDSNTKQFIEQLDDVFIYDIIIAAHILGIPKIILDFGNKIREIIHN